jgi:CRISPR-associated protein Cmr6
MSNANLGWLFYKKMYEKGDDSAHITSTMNALLGANPKETESLNASHSFALETIYPGLLIGSGYTHGLSVESDAKIGFYFDHTTGLPNIPGSSIKGMLRSLFGCGKNDHYPDAKKQMIRDLLSKPDINIEQLVAEIFDGIDSSTKKPLSIYKRDRFLEARIIKTPSKLLSDDYITPHKEPLKNPVPLRFVKVQSGVEYEFSFLLTDGLIRADEKLKLFFQLLQWHGIGAKTNVGYGQFARVDEAQFDKSQKKKQDQHNEIAEQLRVKAAKAAREEELKTLPPEVAIFESSRAEDGKIDTVKLYQMIKNSEVDQELKIPLAKLVKAELQKNPDNWEKAKKKALDRKEFIESLLK